MRIWQIRFQVIKALESLAIPNEIVYEIQESPTYHMEGKGRSINDSQIVCTIAGEGAFRYRNTVYRLTSGRTFMSVVGNPDTAYYYPGHANQAWYFLWISFSGAQASKIINEMNQHYGYVFDLPLDKGFVKHIKAYENQRDTFQVISPSAGAKIVHDALAAFGETVEEKLSTSPQAQLTRSAQEYIAANLNRNLDIALIAEKLHVSREHLTRVFRSQTGISPGHFALEERMRAASHMLMDNRLTCKEVAARLGYDSASSFARAFKAYYSKSPAEFKESNQLI